MIRLLLCDLDGTLVEAWRTTPLPDVRERLLVLRDQGVPVVMVTNQGGVGYRYAHEQRGEWARAAQYPTFEAIQSRLAAIAAVLPLSCGYVSLYHGRPDGRFQTTGESSNSILPSRLAGVGGPAGTSPSRGCCSRRWKI